MKKFTKHMLACLVFIIYIAVIDAIILKFSGVDFTTFWVGFFISNNVYDIIKEQGSK